MGVWIYIAAEASDPYGPACALLQDSVTCTFFRTAFLDENEADAFLEWCASELIDPRLLREDWTAAIDAWRADERLCIHHAVLADDEENHAGCPGCDDCETWRLGR